MRSRTTVKNLFKTLVADGLITEAADVRQATVYFCLGGIGAAAISALLFVASCMPGIPEPALWLWLALCCAPGGWLGARFGAELPYSHPDRQALATAIFNAIPDLEKFFVPESELYDSRGKPLYESIHQFPAVRKWIIFLANLDKVRAVVENFGPSRCWKIK